MKKMAVALTIAGSDSGGGAGIQADLKTFGALGVHGCSAITALTAQNTLGVHGIFTASCDIIRQQIEVVLSDFTVNAIKIGMLANEQIIRCVAEVLVNYPDIPIILDPVMVATSGDRLLDHAAIDALVHYLIPRAKLLTPNLPEALSLTGGQPPKSEAQLKELLERLLELGSDAVLLKGGHFEDKTHSNDYLYDGVLISTFKGSRIQTVNTHGTGCTLSSACTALMASGETNLQQVVKKAKYYIIQTLKHSVNIKLGAGISGLNHFYELNEKL